MTIPPDLLRRLQEVIELREIGVRIAVIDKGVQKLERFPDPHVLAVEPQEILPLLLHEGVSLMFVVEPVKLPHARARGVFVIAKLFFFLGGIGEIRFGRGRFGVTLLQEILPFLEIGERLIGGDQTGLRHNFFLFRLAHRHPATVSSPAPSRKSGETSHGVRG